MKTTLYLGTDPVHYESQGKVTGNMVHYPVIKIVPRPLDNPEIVQAYQDLDRYTHLIFTSKNAVRIFFSHLDSLQLNLKKKTLIAIGNVTADHLAARGHPPQFIAEQESQEGLVSLLRAIT